MRAAIPIGKLICGLPFYWEINMRAAIPTGKLICVPLSFLCRKLILKGLARQFHSRIYVVNQKASNLKVWEKLPQAASLDIAYQANRTTTITISLYWTTLLGINYSRLFLFLVKFF
jgi:hypothetical protein